MAAAPDLEQRLPLREPVEEESEDGAASASHLGAQPATPRLPRAAAGLLLLIAAVLLAFAAASAPPGRPPNAADVASAVGLEAQGPTGALADEVSTSPSPLLPREHTNDGNACADDEEEHMGLCYEKCNTLTHGTHPYRQSAWTCCEHESCAKNPFTLFSCCKHNMGFCSGFDVAGQLEGANVCPHAPGACLINEELFLGVCYMKCSLMTAGLYPFRVAGATCCKRNDATCLIEDGIADSLHGQSLTNATFDVGGGCGDDSPLTHCKPHPPQDELTERPPSAA